MDCWYAHDAAERERAHAEQESLFTLQVVRACERRPLLGVAMT